MQWYFYVRKYWHVRFTLAKMQSNFLVFCQFENNLDFRFNETVFDYVDENKCILSITSVV